MCAPFFQAKLAAILLQNCEYSTPDLLANGLQYLERAWERDPIALNEIGGSRGAHRGN